MREHARSQLKNEIIRLAAASLDLISFWRQASDAIAKAVPYYGAPCWYTLDPASLLVTSHFNEGMAEIPSDWLAQEYYGDDVNKLADIARSRRGISTLYEATGGEPARSPRWHENIRFGGDQELIAALRTPRGEAWGALGLYRERGLPLFSSDELELIRTVAPYLAEGARRALLFGEASDPETPDAPGLIVLSVDWEVQSLTPGVERWLAELPDGDWAVGRLPSCVLSVAGQALRKAEQRHVPGEVAMARVLSRSGTWVMLHGASLASGAVRRVAVIVEPAHPVRIAPLLMSAYGLTQREQEVTRLVLQGHSTSQIAERLIISAQTVQQHLKSVFEKTGVRSRRDLVGRIFFAHYEPRVRNNERRALDGRPLRGGPLRVPIGNERAEVRKFALGADE